MKLGRGFASHWRPENWARDWQQRCGPPSLEQLLRRNEIERFRLILAQKEPKG